MSDQTIPMAFFFPPLGNSADVLKIMNWARQEEREIHVWFGEESGALIVAVDCPDLGEETGTDLWIAMQVEGLVYLGFGAPSPFEWQLGREIPAEYLLTVFEGTVVAIHPNRLDAIYIRPGGL